MIIRVAGGISSEIETYSFLQSDVTVGRSPTSEVSVQVASETVSRNHLRARNSHNRIQIIDLNSSNGTFIDDQQLQPNRWTPVQSTQRVRIAEYQGYLTFQARETSLPSKGKKPQHKQSQKIKQKKEDLSSQSQSSSSRSRSREKGKEKGELRALPFKLSESTLKMLKDMTANGKSKDERIKFLRLMGIGKAEQYWPQIEALAKGKKSGRDGKKTSEELERQFSLSRSGFEKKGLGK